MRPITPRVFARGVTVFALCVGVLAIGVPFAGGSVAMVTDNVPMSQRHPGIEHQSSASSAASSDSADSADESPDEDSAPSRGPSIDPDDSKQATHDKAQTKIVLAVIMLGLLTLVVFGRKKRNKHRIGKQR